VQASLQFCDTFLLLTMTLFLLMMQSLQFVILLS
jgi:hypothetical protein